MVEKNFTEYEREMRDFEKKPLAKDPKELIFPPKSDIKKSEDQEASVLPVSKLSMRKRAVDELREGDRVPLINGNIGYYEKGATFDGKEVIWDVDADEYVPIELIDWKALKGTKESSVNEVKTLSVDDKILTSTKKVAKVIKVSDDLIFWVSIDGEKDFGSDFVEDVEPFGGPGLGPGGVCTCSKCGFAMAHERGVPCYAVTCPKCGAKMSRGQGEPIDSGGITKEVPLEEEIDLGEVTLVGKNKSMKKKAGTWALPFTPEAATTLESIVNRLKDNDISVHEAQEELYDVFGDDLLSDDLDNLQNSITLQAAESIRSRVGTLLDEYDTHEYFTEELDPTAREILEKIVKGV